MATIYGVAIVLNDVNFKAKDKNKQVVERMREEAFFVTKKTAKQFYDWHKKNWNEQKEIYYGKAEPRGRCQLFKAQISVHGRLMNHGEIIESEIL